MELFAQALLADQDDHPVRLMEGVATAANTVQIQGSTTAIECPYITPVVTGDKVLLLGWGTYRIIIGPITQP